MTKLSVNLRSGFPAPEEIQKANGVVSMASLQLKNANSIKLETTELHSYSIDKLNRYVHSDVHVAINYCGVSTTTATL